MIHTDAPHTDQQLSRGERYYRDQHHRPGSMLVSVTEAHNKTPRSLTLVRGSNKTLLAEGTSWYSNLTRETEHLLQHRHDLNEPPQA